jgi:hypothetical protein
MTVLYAFNTVAVLTEYTYKKTSVIRLLWPQTWNVVKFMEERHCGVVLTVLMMMMMVMIG